MVVRTLERNAIQAHHRDESWSMFWANHGDAIRRAEPWNRSRFNALMRRLLSLVVSGDSDGLEPVGDDDGLPWEVGDWPKPADTGTQARCLLTSLQRATSPPGSRFCRGGRPNGVPRLSVAFDT
jgi:hypothetical protein